MFKWKKFCVITSLLFILIVAGCGSGDEKADAKGTDNVSKEMNYTITGIEPGAGQTKTNEKALSAYDNLDGWEQELSSTGAMLTELDHAIDKKEPIVVSAWSPHYMFAKWDIKFLDDPKGIYGKEENGTTIVRKGLKDDKPEAYKMLDRFNWEVEDIEEALFRAKDEDMKKVAKEWVDNHQDDVAEWTKGVNPVNGTPIELVTTPWDEAEFTANVSKIILDQQGFKVKLTPTDPAVLFKAIATGDADASLSPWMPSTHGDLYNEYKSDFEDLGPSFKGAKIGLAVPAYMDIDSIEDLQPKK